MRSGFICRFGPSTKCLVCGLALLALLLPSLSHAQVIEEDGFPVKGGGIGGEPFSLSCPSRLYAQAGESVAISCAATSVPEEGVRYEWEPLSGDGLRLLSDANERSPLFTAPVSGEGAEYAYRLTAMSVGVYETATVTVSVEVVSGGSVQDRGKSPGSPEGCDSFGAFEGFREGCVGEDKAPGAFEPFGGGFEEEEGPDLLFPEAPGLPDRPSGPVRGGGPARQTPPRLECPVAVFLEELETGAIECYASDAAGEEYLEYSWEPVGSTTRDYLDNPRLLPEDAPNPSVVAPEAPVYETLESFRSGETTFRYRYRLTATSRATGLSSREEVEVYVSSSRPSVYCPLEVVVEEGETIVLDCEGVDPLSHRMDYDEEGASILWEWEGLWGTSTAPLAATHLSSPLFTAPAGSAGKQYHYIASMTSSASGVPRMARRRVSVTVNEGEGAGVEVLDEVAADGSSSMSGTSLSDVEWPRITCNGEYDEDLPQEFSFHVHAGTGSLTLDCEAYGGQNEYDATYTYRWTAAGGDTPDTALLSATNIRNPVFDVPDEVSGTVTRRYDLKAEIDYQPHVTRAITASVEVNVMPPSSIICTAPDPVYEGSGALTLICSAQEEPTGATYAWTGTDLADRLTNTDGLTPTFTPPNNVDSDTDYDYTVTLSATGIDNVTADVTVTVLEKPDIVVTCLDNSYSVDEGDGLALVCEASGAPGVNPQYTWSWSPTNDVTGQAIPLAPSRAPTFAAPDDVDRDTTYAYRVTATAANADDGTAEVTVTVRDTAPEPSISCVAPGPVYEKTADFMLDCSVTNEPTGATYAWSVRGSTSDTDDLSSTTILKPTFSVPDDIDEPSGADKDYEYTVTMSATDISDITDDVTVTVLEKPDLICRNPGGDHVYARGYNVYEGDARIWISHDGCQWEGAPDGSSLTYRWTVFGSTPQSALSRLSSMDVHRVRLTVPGHVSKRFTYQYLLTASARNADDGTVVVNVHVDDWRTEALGLACTSPVQVYEGTPDFELSCSVSKVPVDSDPAYVWQGRGTTMDTNQLIAGVDGPAPTFAVPPDVDATTTYEYKVTVSAAGAKPATANVTVRVFDPSALSIACADPEPVYEDSGPLTLSCTEENEPTGATYAWTGTDVDNRLTDTDGLTPTFTPPDNVDADTDYDYTVTMMSGGSEVASADVTVTVLNTLPSIACTATPDRVYEGSADDITVSCSAQNTPSVPFIYAWDGSDDFVNLLKGWNGDWPIFGAPDNVNGDTEYVFTVNIYIGQNGCQPDLPGCALDSVAETDVTVTVLEKPDIAVTCEDSPYEVDESNADIELACGASGAPGIPQYAWSWSPTTNLTDHNTATPTFAVPDDVDQDTTYTYTVTANAANADDGTASVTVTVRDMDSAGSEPVITCNDSEVYEGTADFTLDCSVTDEPTGATYAWAARGSTSDTNDLSSTTILKPTFDVPDNVDADTDYDYTVTLSASGINDVTEDVTVRVLNKPSLALICTPLAPVYEGAADFDLDCVASGAPSGSEYNYVWTGRGSTVVPGQLSSTTVEKPTFDVPDNVDADTDYEYTLTVSADNAKSATADVTVTVLNKKALNVACATPSPVYEGSEDFALDCVASGAPAGSEYTYVWTARGATTNTDLLVSGTGGPTPTFAVPDEVDDNETYEYLLTASAENAIDATAEVTVKVLNLGSIALICASPPLVYEGSEDFALVCSVSGDTGGANYTYEWTARGATQNTDELSATNIASPTFYVPDNVDADTDYDYTVTLSASGINDVTEDVTVRVLNKPSLALVCTPLAPVYEGAADFDLDCVASGAPSGSEYNYVWTGRGSTVVPGQLSSATVEKPTFDVPDNVDADTDYEYTLTVSADNAKSATADVTVTVLNKKALDVACATPSPVYEGSEDFALDCVASGAPAGSEYTYVWTARGATTNTDLLVSGTDGPTPTFAVPEEVDDDKTYEYLLTASAENAIDATAEVTVKVLNLGSIALICASPPLVYEGSEDFALVCSVSGDTGGANYTYEWTARGATQNTDELSATNIASPTFYVPDALDRATTYEYLLTARAANVEDATAAVTVTVLNRGTLAVACAPPPLVYEGSEDFALDCSASGAPAGSGYTYAWSARGSTVNTDLLISGTDGPAPTFAVPDALDATTTYEYLLTVSAENAESATAEVMVTVLNRGTLGVVCADPVSVYEGSADIAFDCSASGAPAGSNYTYAWTARGNTLDTSLLSATDVASPTFYVPDQVDSDETYEYRLTVSTSAENIDPGTFDLTVNVYDSNDLEVVCTDRTVYEGSPPFRLACTASGGPPGVLREWDWSPATHLTGPRIRTPTFTVPANVESDMTFTYTATVTAGSMVATGELTVTVLNKDALAVVCADPGSVYEGSENIMFDCSASGAPGDNPQYTYAWTARGDTPDTALLSDTSSPAPTFAVPEEVDADETYEYLLTVSADNAESATAEVVVTVLDRAPLAFLDDSIADRVYIFTVGEAIVDILLPQAKGGFPRYAYTLAPALPEGLALDDPTRTISGTPLEVSPRTEYTWQVTDTSSETAQIAFFIEVAPAVDTTSPPVAESPPEAAEPSSLESLSLGVGVTVSASSLRFGVQSADTQVSLDPVTDGISTYVSGPYHAGRMTLSPGGGEALDENGEMDLSIELTSPVLLKRADAIEAASIVLSPQWSLAESCEQLSSQAIGSLYTEATLSEDACRLLRFGGELDLTDAASGRYAGSMDLILRSGESEETHTVEVDVTVVPAQQVITIGPRGVRFSTSRELPAGLTEEQNLSIYPHVAFLTEEKPHGVFELSNPSLIPLEVSVSAHFGYTEATANGREVVVEDVSGSRLSDLSGVVDIHPGVLVLQPGEKGLVRYGVKEGALAAMAEKGYAAFFDVVSEPRQYARSDQMPEEVTGEKTARVTMRVPGVYVPGEGASQLRATLLSISYVGSLSATFLLETLDHPFVGEVVAYDGDGRELGRRETLVYTRSRVRVPLDRMPEEGAVFLRFAPRGSDRVPEPASVEWDAPRRDIGAADKDRTRPPATLVQKP